MRVRFGFLIVSFLFACGDEPLPNLLERSTLAVPLDENDPSKGTVDLAYVRYRALDLDRRVGALVLHFGGPGSSAVSLLPNVIRLWADTHPEIRTRFDIIGLDELGVGQSRPIDCNLSNIPTPMTEGSTEAVVLAEAEAYADACQTADPDLLGQLGTARVVRDLDRLREHLGEDKLSFLGYSYGTMVAAAYAATYPDRVHTAVLDAVVDPNAPWEDWTVNRTGGFESTLNRYLNDCSRQASCTFGGLDAQTAFDELLASLPPGPEGGEGFSQAELMFAAVVLLSDERLQPDFDDALTAATRSDFAALRLAIESGGGGDAFYGTLCIDIARPSLDEIRGFRTELLASSPRFGPTVSSQYLPCAYWGAEAQPGNWDLSLLPPTLLINSVRDPRTPHFWAERVHEQIPNSALIEVAGYHHAHSFFTGRDCIDDAAFDYLVTGELPDDKSCR